MSPSVSERLLAMAALEAKWPGGLMPELTAIRAEIEAVAKNIRWHMETGSPEDVLKEADRLAKGGK